jgi:H+/Cl- antiporter ClcA
MAQLLGFPKGVRRIEKAGDFTIDRRVLPLILMALVVGTMATGSAWVLLKMIAVVTNLVWFGQLSAANATLADAHPNFWMVLVPPLGGLIIGLMARYGSEKIRGHGIPEAIEAILIGGSRIQPKVAFLKPLSSAISIGTGGPFGAEGPIIMTGGALGSLFSQHFRLTDVERKTLLVAGAAAGMTAIFGTPVAAILLAVELLLFEWKPRSFLPVVAAVATAASWRPLLIGLQPLFPSAADATLPWWGLLCCVGVGILTGLQSGVMSLLLYKIEDLFRRLPMHWMWWPAIGGVIVGLGGLAQPSTLGAGYDVIANLLTGHVVVATAVSILAVKSVIWLVSLASGTSGGILAPLLIIGGSAGWLEGLVLPGSPTLWALVGMAAMMGGAMRAPLTAILFAVELTGNFGALLPLIIATGTAYSVTVLLLKRSILTEKIARRGRHLSSEYTVDPFSLRRVGEVMVTAVETLPDTLPISQVMAIFSSDEPRKKSYPIVDDEGRALGMATRADVLRWRADLPQNALTLGEFAAERPLIVAYPDEVLGDVVDRMIEHDFGRLPVVERGTDKLLGLLTRKDILRIRAVATSAERHRQAFFGLHARTQSDGETVGG